MTDFFPAPPIPPKSFTFVDAPAGINLTRDGNDHDLVIDEDHAGKVAVLRFAVSLNGTIPASLYACAVGATLLNHRVLVGKTTDGSATYSQNFYSDVLIPLDDEGKITYEASSDFDSASVSLIAVFG